MKTFRHHLTQELVEARTAGQLVHGTASVGDSTVTVTDNTSWLYRGAMCRVAGRKGVYVVVQPHIACEDNEYMVEVTISNAVGYAGRVPLHKLTQCQGDK